MGKNAHRRDYSEFREGINKNGYVVGGFVTPGAGVNVNIAAYIGSLEEVTFEEDGVANLAVTAGAQAGESVVNNVVVTAATGVASVVAGTSAPTASATAPAVAEGTVLLATVTVVNGAAAITQSMISNKARLVL